MMAADEVGYRALMRDGLQSVRAGNDCALHREHSPRLLAVVQQLVFPGSLQIAVWGEVRDGSNVPMCPTGCMHVMLALSDLLAGTTFTHNYSGVERRWALRAFDLYKRAKESKERR
jgi:hypothetical protein